MNALPLCNYKTLSRRLLKAATMRGFVLPQRSMGSGLSAARMATVSRAMSASRGAQSQQQALISRRLFNGDAPLRQYVSSREPRKRLPVEVLAIKKDMNRLQRQYRGSGYEGENRFPIIGFGIALTIVTYMVCLFGCDKDSFVRFYTNFREDGIIEAWNDFAFDPAGDCDEDD